MPSSCTLAVGPDAASPYTSKYLKVLIGRALTRERSAVAALADFLIPDIQLAVVWELHRWRQHRRIAQQERNDMVQVVFLELIEKDKILRSWAPERGTLRRYIRGVAKRKVRNELKRKRGSLLTRDPMANQHPEQLEGSDEGFERRLQAREQLRYLYKELCKRLSPDGRLRFSLLFIEKQSIEQVADQLGVRRNTIDRWLADLRKLVRRLADEHGLDIDYDRLSA